MAKLEGAVTMIKFYLNNHDPKQCYFEGIQNKHGRYEPIKKYYFNRYKDVFIEVINTHTGVEFTKREVTLL